MKTRYFYFPEDKTMKTKTRFFPKSRYRFKLSRVVVFLGGSEPGYSFWANGDKGLSWWTFKDMETERAKEISRDVALLNVKNLPE